MRTIMEIQRYKRECHVLDEHQSTGSGPAHAIGNAMANISLFRDINQPGAARPSIGCCNREYH